MAIFNCYVSSPEGTACLTRNLNTFVFWVRLWVGLAQNWDISMAPLLRAPVSLAGRVLDMERRLVSVGTGDTSPNIWKSNGKSIRIICIYLDNPPVQNYRSKSETAIIIAGCLNFRCFQFFSPFQFPHFGFLIFFAVSSGFFAVSLGFFAVSKLANVCNMRKMQNLFGGRKTCRQQ